MSNIPDPILQGLQRGWKVLGGKHGGIGRKIAQVGEAKPLGEEVAVGKRFGNQFVDLGHGWFRLGTDLV